MRLQITRDADGNVIITNLTTGKSESCSTGIVGRPTERVVDPTQDLPAHMWSRLA